MTALYGIWGRPYIDLTKIIDPSPLDLVHEEVCLALARVETSYTGGTLKWMGVTAPTVDRDGYADAMRAISSFSPPELARFASLADDDDIIADTIATSDRRARELAFGDETDRPFSKAQMLYLKYRYGVYFPWKVVYHLLENVWWEDKNSGDNKTFGDDVVAFFPRTVEFIRQLPFREIGRCVLFGLEAHDHAPLHRDTAPDPDGEIGHSISICPVGNKTLFLASPDLSRRVPVTSRLYWFNDMDWHGVEAAPTFRYSIRVDGVFEPEFVEQLRHLVLL
jgi:hypothetical protein